MLLDALDEAIAQVGAIFKALAELPEGERDRLYQRVGVGRHVRHIVDHFNAVKDLGRTELGVPLVDYNKRSRDSVIEKDFAEGRAVVGQLSSWLRTVAPATLQSPVTVCAEISCSHTENGEFASNLAREILYLINHTIHHVAYTKLLLKQEGLALAPEIGIAPCTASFLRSSSP